MTNSGPESIVRISIVTRSIAQLKAGYIFADRLRLLFFFLAATRRIYILVSMNRLGPMTAKSSVLKNAL